MAEGPGQHWCVYLLRCSDGTLYTGVTSDITRRLRQHNGELRGGAAYTRGRRPVELLWRADASDRAAAQRREAAIRRLSRARKLRIAAAADSAGDQSASSASRAS